MKSHKKWCEWNPVGGSGCTCGATAWTAGPPPGRGHWWIVWRGVVVPVEISPAIIYRNDPNAKLLLKTLGGLAYEYEANKKDITHHAVLEGPDAP